MKPLRFGLLLTAALLCASFVPAYAEAPPKTTPWSRATVPAKGRPSSIGEYSSGCLRGAAQLPLDGEGYQVMHPSRRRYYGHPDLVDFVRKLGQGVHAAGLKDLMVGDLSQPRGGPAPGGHASHQTGLDVDLWYWLPKEAAKRRLPAAERESVKARSVLDGPTSSVRSEESERVTALLKLAAGDARVTRVFVHPIIKRMLCSVVQGERAWLSKIRPWYGHDDHFHVRLDCPSDSANCVAQTKQSEADGCKEIDWWFSKEAQQDRKKAQSTYQAKVGKAPGMPLECSKLLVGVPAAEAEGG